MSATPVSSLVLSFEEARRLVESQAQLISAPETEVVDLLSGASRVLAESVVADRDIPPFPRSTRDGFAVRAQDLSSLPAILEVIGEIKAGEMPEAIPQSIGPGQAVAIMTGAPVPAGADAVVMVEHTTRTSSRVQVSKGVESGENIVPRGAEAQQQSMLLSAGTRLQESAIALAASVGKPRLLVYKRPRVAVLTTGDEIVGVEETPGPTQIRNSNSYSLAVQIQRAGGEPTLLPIAPDEPEQLRALIEQGLAADLLLMTGGVSMGRYDLVEQVLSEMKAEFFFTGAKIQPGRPVVFGRCNTSSWDAGVPASQIPYTYFFGLPGNPVSTMVTFELFARPLIEALAGQTRTSLKFLHARLRSDVRVKPGLTRFLPATLSDELEKTEVELVGWQGSGDIAATARANCYAVIPPDHEQIPAGEWIAVMPR